jgi:hypothetical protein
LEFSIRLEDADPRRALLGLPPTDRLTAGEVAHWQACLDDAWALLVARHRPAAEILAAVLQVIVPVRPDPGARGISATSADAYGAVAMSVPADPVELAVGLLHETQHSLLNAVHHLFDLHTDPAALGYSPWRDDPRPASGVLHGTYAYLAVTRFWRTEWQADPADRVAAFEFARWRAAVAATANSLLIRDELTPAGHRFVTALRDEVQPWLADPVDPEIARLAAAASLDHELRWRLRNRHLDHVQVTAVADAWRRVRIPHQRVAPDLSPATAMPVPRLIPAPRRALENSPRLDLIHQCLAGVNKTGGSGHPAGSRATAADNAFLRGDYGTAWRAYRKAVDLDLEDDSVWAGLALAARDDALIAQLEVVVAVCRELGPDHPDPRKLAAWISGQVRSCPPEPRRWKARR